MDLVTAFVLGGGGARGAYQVGVLSYLEEELGPELGRELRAQVLCGTSIGSVHACQLAALADAPSPVLFLKDHWQTLRVKDVIEFDWRDLMRMFRASVGRLPSGPWPERAGGLVDSGRLARYLLKEGTWPRIGRNLRAGRVLAIAIGATHVATGKPTVFIQRAKGELPIFDENYRATQVRIGPRHALASSAIPLLFPPVRIGKELYLDGGLRLNVPLSPAVKLGAQRILLISLRSDVPPAPEVVPRPPFLLGKALSALLIESIEQDLDRLSKINAILEAGVAAYGHDFPRQLNSHLTLGHRFRFVRALRIRPSRDLAQIACEYLSSKDFDVAQAGGAGKMLRDLVQRDRAFGDLASYLLFDGGYAERLIALGRSDAKARKDELIRFWSNEAQSPAELIDLEAGTR